MKGNGPKNASLSFTIFTTFMASGGTVRSAELARSGNGILLTAEPAAFYFGEYPPDFFDFIVIDECHRGHAEQQQTEQHTEIKATPQSPLFVGSHLVVGGLFGPTEYRQLNQQPQPQAAESSRRRAAGRKPAVCAQPSLTEQLDFQRSNDRS